ncbi:MAG: hypothetical protein DRH70_07905 [Candidatus Coatesbacteria bacterium]|nr:MAG: hypothetical protein DRH70_07905 [Candidatus Coatesbacteria bacterium]
MNPLTRLARTAYYQFFSTISKIILPDTDRLSALGSLLGNIRYHVGYVGKMRSRRSYLQYLREALPHLSEIERRRILRQFWINHEHSFLELFLLPTLTKENIDDFVQFDGLEVLDECLALGKGVVLAVPHFGSPRFLHVALAIKGYPMNVISSRYEEASETVRRILLEPSLKWHNVGHPDMSPRWMFTALKQNEILQISPTAFGASKGCWITFLGGRAMVSSSPVRLALSTGAALVPAFISRLQGYRHRIEIRAPLELKHDTNRQRLIQSTTEELMKIVEQYAAAYPEQFSWMWFVIRRQQAEGLAEGE